MTLRTQLSDELRKLAHEVPLLIGELSAEISSASTRMNVLRKAGLIYATEHWRKDREGVPKYLYLLYTHKQGEQRCRIYIGCDPERIAEARQGLSRASEYDQIRAKLVGVLNQVNNISKALWEARRYLSRTG